jgi:hypothetical protein
MIEPVEPQVWNGGERSHVLRDTDSMSQEELRLEIWRLRDELAGAEASLAGLRAQLEGSQRDFLAGLEMSGVANDDHLKKERDLYRSQVEEMQSSTTWRIGRFFVRPSGPLRRLLGRSSDDL